MSETERQRRLKAIAEILSLPEIPSRLRRDLEAARYDLVSCSAVQARVARSWQGAASRAAERRAG